MRNLDYREPAVLRGIIMAVLGLLAALGIVTTEQVDGIGEALIPVVAFLLPLLQAVWTRMAVWSPKSKDEAVAVARAS